MPGKSGPKKRRKISGICSSSGAPPSAAAVRGLIRASMLTTAGATCSTRRVKSGRPVTSGAAGVAATVVAGAADCAAGGPAGSGARAHATRGSGQDQSGEQAWTDTGIHRDLAFRVGGERPRLTAPWNTDRGSAREKPAPAQATHGRSAPVALRRRQVIGLFGGRRSDDRRQARFERIERARCDRFTEAGGEGARRRLRQHRPRPRARMQRHRRSEGIVGDSATAPASATATATGAATCADATAAATRDGPRRDATAGCVEAMAAREGSAACTCTGGIATRASVDGRVCMATMGADVPAGCGNSSRPATIIAIAATEAASAAPPPHRSNPRRGPAAGSPGDAMSAAGSVAIAAAMRSDRSAAAVRRTCPRNTSPLSCQRS